MKRITMMLCIAAGLFACKSSEKKSEEPKNEETKVAAAATTEPAVDNIPDSVKNKNWKDYMTPGKEHQMLASWDGKWTGNVSMWMVPNTPPSMSTMSCENKMIFNGLYQQSSYSGNMNGMPFEGQSTVAFDKHKKMFISTWIDNMGSGIMESTGTWDDASKSITFRGKMVDPATGRDMDFREVFKVVDDNNQIMEMYGPAPDGKEFKTMEIRLTRNK